jgi:hypothetical protein
MRVDRRSQQVHLLRALSSNLKFQPSNNDRHARGYAANNTLKHDDLVDNFTLEDMTHAISDDRTTHENVLPLWGNFPIQRVYEGQGTWELEVHIPELPQVCFVLATLSPPLPSPAPGRVEAAAYGGAGRGARACGVS